MAALVAFGFRPVAVFSRMGVFPAGTVVPIDMATVQEFAAETGVAPPAQEVAIPAVSESEFAEMAKNGLHPIFLEDIGKADVDHFKAELRYLRHRLRLFGNRILHPAALTGLHPFRARTYMLTGFPSSGNMIFQRCLSDVLVANPDIATAKRSRFEGLLSHYAMLHWHTLSEVLTTHFDDDGLYVHSAAPCGLGLAGVYMEVGSPASRESGAGGTIVIGGVRMWHHAWANPYHGSHEPITLGAAAAYRAQNVSCVQIVRHPLDVLVSIAGKVSKASSIGGLSGLHARNEAVVSLMNRDIWAYSMIDALEKYYCAIAAAKDHLELLAYEDLLSDPVTTIQKIATIFGGSVSATTADRIWQTWADKPAAGGAGHRWDPRAGKWKRFIPPRFADRLIGSDMEAAANAFGYTFDRDDFRGSSDISKKVELDDRSIALEEGRYSTLVGKDIVLVNGGVYWSSNPDTGMFISGPVHARDSIDRLLGSLLLKDVMIAGSYFDVSPKVQMKDYLCQTAPVMASSDRWRARLNEDTKGDEAACVSTRSSGFN